MYFTKPFLAREYTGDYLKSAAGAQFKMHNSFRLIFLQGGKRAPRVAQHQDFVPGTTILPNGKELERPVVARSDSPRVTRLSFEARSARLPTTPFMDGSERRSSEVTTFSAPTVQPLAEAAVVVIFLLCFAVPLDFKRGKKMKYGRLLRGPVMSAPSSSTRF